MSREGVIYTHYGHTKFEPETFEPIKNRQMFNKPWGGFWASPNDAEFGWKQWNEREQFAETRDDNKIEFTLKPNTRVLELHSVKDAEEMIQKYKAPMPPEFDYLSQLGFGGSMLINIDFEAIARDYDAIEYFISDDFGLYNTLYGWDCDSILILNKDVVVPIEERKIETEKPIADTVLEDIVITPKPPTYKQDFYQIAEDVLEDSGKFLTDDEMKTVRKTMGKILDSEKLTDAEKEKWLKNCVIDGLVEESIVNMTKYGNKSNLNHNNETIEDR